MKSSEGCQWAHGMGEKGENAPLPSSPSLLFKARKGLLRMDPADQGRGPGKLAGGCLLPAARGLEEAGEKAAGLPAP